MVCGVVLQSEALIAVRNGVDMNWPVVEVVIGLAFFFWLMSVLASAINEAIANVLALRSKGLTRGLTSMLGEEHVTDFLNTAIVLSQRKTPKPGQTSRRPSRQPSYLSASLFAEGLQELFGQRGAAFRLDLAMVTNQHLRSRLETFADKVDNDSVRFRKELEDWFDATMERVSGWYKRRSHLILFLIGITVIGALILLGQSVHDLWHAITTAMPR